METKEDVISKPANYITCKRCWRKVTINNLYYMNSLGCDWCGDCIGNLSIADSMKIFPKLSKLQFGFISELVLKMKMA